MKISDKNTISQDNVNSLSTTDKATIIDTVSVANTTTLDTANIANTATTLDTANIANTATTLDTANIANTTTFLDTAINLKKRATFKSLFSSRDLAYCAVFVVLIIVGAFIKIPIPLIPITFQVTFTTLAALILGAKLGTFSIIVYIIMGLCGIPIFSSGGGIGYVMQPSFGYMIGFVFGAMVTGWLAYRPSPKNRYLRHFLAGLAGLLVIYVIGCAYMYLLCNYALHVPLSASKVIVSYFLMLFPKDLALVAIACIASSRLAPYLARQGFVARKSFKK